MRILLAAGFLAVTAAPVAAETFGGFSGVDRPYLVNSDKVCTPIVVVGGAAKGPPTCVKAAADVLARLSFKDPIVQRGAKATFAATAASRTLTVMRTSGDKVVVWDAMDPIGKVVDVYASQYEDRVAVAYSVRRMGKEVIDIIAFDLGRPAQAAPQPDPATVTPTPVVTAPPEDPALTKALATARKSSKAKALAAWRGVLAVDADNSEAHYQIAVIAAGKKDKPGVLAALAKLVDSKRPDAVEWLVEARFGPAFAFLRADPTYRERVGLDRKGTTSYEKLMGFGGQWEQTGTSCDKPEVRLTATRDRVVRIRVKSSCSGQTFNLPFKGRWRIEGNRVVLTFPNKGKAVSADDEAGCMFESVGDEDSLRCSLDRDLDFVVLPTRR